MNLYNIRFGNPKWLKKKPNINAYCYINNSPNMFFVTNLPKDRLIEVKIWCESIISHESLHKILYEVEGEKASKGLDLICANANWEFKDDSGICF